MAGTRENYFRTSDDAILYFEDHCPDKGKPIVLVPGFCCTTRFFENNIGELSKEHRVITFDPRGQGCSSKGLHGHTIRRNCEDIKELLDYLDVKMLLWSAGQWPGNSL
jgi:pimeloyl-ACP methyl ester carboxylesterase